MLFPEYEPSHDREDLVAEWDGLLEVRQAVSKALEEFRQKGAIGNSLEARVILHAGGEKADLLQRHSQDLRYLFLVSQVEVVADTGNEVRILTERALGEKCERCWNYSPAVGANTDFPTICERCAQSVNVIH